MQKSASFTSDRTFSLELPQNGQTRIPRLKFCRTDSRSCRNLRFPSFFKPIGKGQVFVSGPNLTPEQQARDVVDMQLSQAGWIV